MEESKKNQAAVEEAYSKATEEVYKGNNKEVLPIEKEVAKQDENKKGYKKNKKAFVITIIILSVLIIGCIVGLILYNNHYHSLTRGVLLYQDNGCVMSEKPVFKDAIYSAITGSPFALPENPKFT